MSKLQRNRSASTYDNKKFSLSNNSRDDWSGHLVKGPQTNFDKVFSVKVENMKKLDVQASSWCVDQCSGGLDLQELQIVQSQNQRRDHTVMNNYTIVPSVVLVPLLCSLNRISQVMEMYPLRQWYVMEWHCNPEIQFNDHFFHMLLNMALAILWSRATAATAIPSIYFVYQLLCTSFILSHEIFSARCLWKILLSISFRRNASSRVMKKKKK